MSVVGEFKEFAIKGNAVDMAVGILLGVSFNKVVNSLVNDIIMPPVALLMGGVPLNNLVITLRHAQKAADGTDIPAIAIRYGMLLSACLEFFIVAVSMFFVVKVMNRIIRMRDLTSY
jgi:large conductance mechanosensitive channel